MNWVSKLLGTPYALNPDVANNDKFLMDREKNLTYWCVDKGNISFVHQTFLFSFVVLAIGLNKI